MKDGRGFWVGDYWGVISFGTNRAVVSATPEDLGRPAQAEYRNRVALNGSPLTSGSAVAGVFSAALANGGSLNNIGPGSTSSPAEAGGNFIPVQATPQTIASGQTPIVIDWDYLNLAYVKEFPAARIADDDPDDRGLRSALLPGDQRNRPAPVGGPALAGVPLLRRGPAALAEGLLAPGAVHRHGAPQGDPAGAAHRAAVRGDLLEVRFAARPRTRGRGRRSTPSGRRRSAPSALATTRRYGRGAAAGSDRPRRSSRSRGSASCRSSSTPSSSCSLPAGQVLLGAFQGPDGGLTLDNSTRCSTSPTGRRSRTASR